MWQTCWADPATHLRSQCRSNHPFEIVLAPNFQPTLLQPDGSTRTTTLAAWRARYPNQPVALHFWADWCPNCRIEEHSITRLSANWPVLTMTMQSGTPDHVQQR